MSTGPIPPFASPSVSPTGKPDTISELRAKITQMKQSLQAVEKDSKTDCKTKDWEMQALQRDIQVTQQQISAQEAIAAPKRSAVTVAKNDTANEAISPGKRLSLYA